MKIISDISSLYVCILHFYPCTVTYFVAFKKSQFFLSKLFSLSIFFSLSK